MPHWPALRTPAPAPWQQPLKTRGSLNVKGRPDHAIKGHQLFSLWPQPLPSPASSLRGLLAREEKWRGGLCPAWQGAMAGTAPCQEGIIKTTALSARLAASPGRGLSPRGQDSGLIAKGAAPAAAGTALQPYKGRTSSSPNPGRLPWGHSLPWAGQGPAGLLPPAAAVRHLHTAEGPGGVTPPAELTKPSSPCALSLSGVCLDPA